MFGRAPFGQGTRQVNTSGTDKIVGINPPLAESEIRYIAIPKFKFDTKLFIGDPFSSFPLEDAINQLSAFFSKESNIKHIIDITYDIEHGNAILTYLYQE